jgi:hypothetical protein
LPRKPPFLQFVWRGHRRASLSFDALQLQLKVRAINPHHLTSFRKTSIDDQRPDVITGLRFCAAAVTPSSSCLPALCILCVCGLLQRYRSSALSSPVRSTPADSVPLTTVEPITIANERKTKCRTGSSTLGVFLQFEQHLPTTDPRVHERLRNLVIHFRPQRWPQR